MCGHRHDDVATSLESTERACSGSRPYPWRVGAALGWGVVAASSLVLGMLLGLARSWPSRLIGLVLAFGAGALVSAVSFELFEEGIARGIDPEI